MDRRFLESTWKRPLCSCRHRTKLWFIYNQQCFLQEDRWQWKCRRKNLPVTNFREQIFLEKWRGNKWKTQSWVYSGISKSNAPCGVRRKTHRAFLFLQECLLWTKGKLLLLYQQYSCQLIFEKLTLSQCSWTPSHWFGSPPPPPPLQNFSVSICSSSWIHSAFFRVCENLTFHTHSMSNNYSCESPWNMIFFLHVKYIFAYKM